MLELSNARTKDQREKMEECARLNRCPFCMEHFSTYHDAPIIKNGNGWIITANDNPYDGTKHHYLAIHKKHVTSIEHLTTEDSAELISLFSWLAQHLQTTGATILMRFGDMLQTGATIAHLHAHLIVGENGKEGKIEKLKVPVGYKRIPG